MKRLLSISNSGKGFLLFILLGFVCQNVSAQSTATSTLNVVLTAVQSVTVANNSTINLAYNTASAYQNGVSSGALTGHVAVFSTNLFTVTVSASGPLTNGSYTIPINTITLVATAGTDNPTTVSTVTNVVLSTTPQTLIHNTTGELTAPFAINYESSGGLSYINVPSGTYTATITYTISPS
ncbi:MAG: hypothetical protein ACYCOO_09020 [Chitinophagaceae bacterium]